MFFSRERGGGANWSPASVDLCLQNKDIVAPVILNGHYSIFECKHLKFIVLFQDVEYLASRLPNVKYKYRIPFKKFNHIDYMWAIDSKKLLYNDVIQQINNVTNSFYYH